MKVKTSVILVFVTIGVLGCGLYAVKFLEPSSPTMGDWGDYIGGLVGIATLIWLVVGHIETQVELQQSKEDLRQQAEFTQEAIGALARIASGTQVQAAEVLADAEPLFVHTSSTTIASGMKKFQMRSMVQSGYIALRNEGGSVSVVEVKTFCEDFTAKFEGPHILNRGTTFRLILNSKKGLNASGNLNFLINFKDRFGRAGSVSLTAPSFEASPTIKTTMGRTN